MVITVTADNFDLEVKKSSQPVLVDFSAVWCGPCQMVAPIVDQLAEDFSGKAKVAKVDIDASQDLAEQFKVMSVPTLLFFKNGEVVDKIVGAVPKTMLVEKLNSLL